MLDIYILEEDVFAGKEPTVSCVTDSLAIGGIHNNKVK